MKLNRRNFLTTLMVVVGTAAINPLKLITAMVPKRTFTVTFHGGFVLNEDCTGGKLFVEEDLTVYHSQEIDDELDTLFAQEIADQIDRDLMAQLTKGNEAWNDTIYPGKNQRHKVQVQNEITTAV